MAELKKHALLLSLMAILIIAKFIVVPIFDWQNNELQNIKLLAKKQQKITQVLNGQDNTANSNATLKSINKLGDSIFFTYQTESAFKLKQQKMFESLLAKHYVQSERIGWQVTTELPNLSATQYQLQLSVKGQTHNVVSLLAELENHNKLIEIKDFNVNFKGQNEIALGQIFGDLTLRLYAMNKA